jgi:hypothetical protein
LAPHPTEELEFIHNFYSALSAERHHLGKIEISIPGAQYVHPALNSGEQDRVVLGIAPNDRFGNERFDDRCDALQ